MSGPKPCPLSVTFTGFGMQLANPYYVFAVTNRSELPFQFMASGRGEGSEERTYQQPYYNGAFRIGATNICRVITPVMPSDGPFRLCIVCVEPWTKWEKRREICAKWLEKRGLTKLGNLIAVVKKNHTVYSAPVKLDVALPWPSYYHRESDFNPRPSPRACWIASDHLRMVSGDSVVVDHP